MPAEILALASCHGEPQHRARGAAPLVVWSGMMRTIGAISDTHGLLRPRRSRRLPAAIPSSMSSPDVLARLGALAPVHAVRGNVDHGAWSANLPVTQRIEIDGFRIYVIHILAELDPQAADNVDAVIYGHSHSPRSRQRTAHSCSIRAVPARAASAYP